MAECKLVKSGEEKLSLQGLMCRVGISAESVGSRGIHMQILRIPEGGEAPPHLHENHETAIYTLEGWTGVWWGERLENYTEVGPGDFFYIPANCPHLPRNIGWGDVVAVVARTDPNEQESVRFLDLKIPENSKHETGIEAAAKDYYYLTEYGNFDSILWSDLSEECKEAHRKRAKRFIDKYLKETAEKN